MTTIAINADRLAKAIRNNVETALRLTQDLQDQIEGIRERAAQEKQPLGNYSLDFIAVMRANETALHSLKTISDLSDGLIDVEEATL